MDPVTALSVAGVVLQFLEAGVKALEICKQVRDSQDGAAANNRDIEGHTNTLKHLYEELEAGTKSNNQAGRRITKIAKECVATSNELLALLYRVRDAGNAKFSASVKTTFRTMRERKTIEKLQNVLKERRALLDSAMIQDIRNRVDLAVITQTKQFSNLSDATKDIAKALQATQIALSRQKAELEFQFASARSQNEKLAYASAAGHRQTHDSISKLQSRMDDKFADLQEISLKDELLGSLFYPEYTSRKEMLSLPAERTFDWIFGDQNGNENGQPGKGDNIVDRSSFSNWLKSTGSIYWICGKPGSGKSTLMAYIAQDKRAKDLLTQSNPSNPVYIASFFFWRSGSELQRSMRGLLRSLLYQLIDEVPEIAQHILKDLFLSKGRIPSWSERRLASLLKDALEAVRRSAICFIIDGLDELEGDTDELLDVAFSMQHLAHVKFCVSGRPDVSLSRRLSTCAQLRMEELNYEDIQTFAIDKLRYFDQGQKMAERISSRAEGIFLWAALATQSIVRGMKGGDDQDMLSRRLDDLPSEINALFKQMLRDVDTVHKESLGFFFRALEIEEEPNIALLTASRMSGEIQSYPDFWKLCEQLETQILAQSRGMLQVQCNGGEEDDFMSEQCSIWAISQQHLEEKPMFAAQVLPNRCLACNLEQMREDRGMDQMRPWFHNQLRDRTTSCRTWTMSQGISSMETNTSDNWMQRVATISARREGDNGVNFNFLKSFEKTRIMWVHRSAYDFVFGDGTGIGDAVVLPSKKEVALALVIGQIKLLASAPSRRPHHSIPWSEVSHSSPGFQSQSGGQARLGDIIDWIGRHRTLLVDHIDHLLDELKMLAKFFSFDELVDDSSHSYFMRHKEDGSVLEVASYSAPADGEYLPSVPCRGESIDTNFFYVCIQAGLTEYVQPQLKQMMQQDDSWWLGTQMIRNYLGNRVRLQNVNSMQLLSHSLGMVLERFDRVNKGPSGELIAHAVSINEDTYQDISWTPFLNSYDGFSSDGMLLTSLCSAWAKWSYSLVRHLYIENGFPEGVNNDVVDVIRMYANVFAKFDIRMGTVFHQGAHPMKDRILLQGPAQLFPSTSVIANASETMRRQIEDATNSLPSTFRLFCKHRSTNALSDDNLVLGQDVAIFDVDESLNPWLVNHANEALEDILKDDDFRDSLIANVWEDTDGQLDAWQQLYVLACIRTCHPPKRKPKKRARVRKSVQFESKVIVHESNIED